LWIKDERCNGFCFDVGDLKGNDVVVVKDDRRKNNRFGSID